MAWTPFAGPAPGGYRVITMLADAHGIYIATYYVEGEGSTEREYSQVWRWNGSAWEMLGDNLAGYITAMVWMGDDLYRAWTNRGLIGGVQRWTDGQWTNVGGGIGGFINVLGTDGTSLYAGGWDLQVGGVAKGALLRWTGTDWDTVGGVVSWSVNAMIWVDHHLYIGGSIYSAGGLPMRNIARWDGACWQSVGAGVPHEVMRLGSTRTGVFMAMIEGSRPELVWHLAEWQPVWGIPRIHIPFILR